MSATQDDKAAMCEDEESERIDCFGPKPSVVFAACLEELSALWLDDHRV